MPKFPLADFGTVRHSRGCQSSGPPLSSSFLTAFIPLLIAARFGMTRAIASLERVMKLGAKNGMLRIAVRSSQNEDKWILEGRLAGQVVDELTAAWKKTGRGRAGCRSVVDLVDVTFVDERGEQAL